MTPEQQNQFYAISLAIKSLAIHTSSEVEEILTALTGLCIDEEEAGELLIYITEQEP